MAFRERLDVVVKRFKYRRRWLLIPYKHLPDPYVD